MAALINKDGMIWFRPLIELQRTQLREYLTMNKISWFEDPSNKNMKFDRVKMREAQSFLDSIGLTVSRLSETAQKMSIARNSL